MLIGNCAEVLKTLPNESVDCCVTSPPYWGLRDYKTEPLIWDASPECEHDFSIEHRRVEMRATQKDWNNGEGYGASRCMDVTSAFCSKCGAWKGQLGLEPSPDLYIKHLVGIFDEVKRVLKRSGTLWVNLGDTYSGGNGTNNNGLGKGTVLGKQKEGVNTNNPLDFSFDCPDKCLVQIPSRFSLSMVDHGWILRNRLIWHKPNCMPSSAKDRFTVDYEDFFFFVKSKRYFFEPQYEPHTRLWDKSNGGNLADIGHKKKGVIETKDTHPKGYPLPNPNGRNKRCVWTISTKPYSGAHFAVFPTELIETPIKAGCPKHGTVLDPFAGSGTVLEYCRKHDLNAIGIELNPKYKELATERAMLDIPQIDSFVESG